MASYDSKYDKGRSAASERTADFPNFSQQEHARKKYLSATPK